MKENTAHCGVLFMVRHIDLSWNTLEPSLVLMYEKLTELGWTYYDGEICIIEPETEESQCRDSTDCPRNPIVGA